MISQINCFVLNASLKMSNVILGIESLSPVLLVLCYICNKCLLVGEENGVYFTRECVLVSKCLEIIAGRVIGIGSLPSTGVFLYRKGREDEILTSAILQGFVLTRCS